MTVKTLRSRRVGDGPTIADVARAAGVSPMTVSRVVNRASHVLPATRSKVEQAIAELGYVPNAAARSLAGRRHCRIALLHSNPSAAYLSEFLVGSLAGASHADAEIVAERWQSDETPAALAKRLVQHRIDAVLAPPPLCENAELVAAMRAEGLACARIATGLDHGDAATFSIDDEGAARAMTEHLIALGHRRIGFILGDPNLSASNLRWQGYQAAIAAAGLDYDPGLIAGGDFTWRSGFLAAEALLSLPLRPTAIFASNDDMAAAAISAAHRHRLDVPGDLTVVGFDDTAMASTVWPEITTIRQPIAEMARLAAIELAEEIRASSPDATVPPGRRRLPFELVRRNSDSPPPQA